MTGASAPTNSASIRSLPTALCRSKWRRGQRALHYHLFALEPLVTMAELASANGDDLYAYSNSRLHLLVARTVAGLADNQFFVDKAGVRRTLRKTASSQAPTSPGSRPMRAVSPTHPSPLCSTACPSSPIATSAACPLHNRRHAPRRHTRTFPWVDQSFTT